ncbi:MAG: phosphatidate cytidylyltransferase [Bacilli bacterium]|nr:phosphatidate cytidylyltransferase [Bacilli bacterium]
MSDKRRPIFQPNELSNATKVSMRTRIITALVAIAIVLPAVIIGDWLIFAVICIACGMGVIEIIRCAKMKYSKALYILGFILAILILLWPAFRAIPNMNKDWRIFDCYDQLYVSATILFAGIGLSAITVITDKNFTIIDACFIFTTIFLISFGFQCALFLRYYPIAHAYPFAQNIRPDTYFSGFINAESCLLLLFVAVGACLNDAFAYFVGVFFGKNKMNERLSPKKTWEGFFGGVFLTAIALTGMALGLSAGGHPVLKGVIDLERWYHVVILSFIIPLVSTGGDLFFSAIKRHYSIKDFSNIMPGHGGILDRCDSILFAVITVAIYVCIFADQAAGGIHLP